MGLVTSESARNRLFPATCIAHQNLTKKWLFLYLFSSISQIMRKLHDFSSSLVQVLETCECPWRWNLLLRLFHYYIFKIDLILGSHFFFCDNFESVTNCGLIGTIAPPIELKSVSSLSILHDDHPFYIKVSEVSRGRQVHMPLYAIVLLV